MPTSSEPPSIFSERFLEDLARLETDDSAEREAAWSGPWKVADQGEGFAVLRDGDPEPGGAFDQRYTACLVAAVLPLIGREPAYTLRNQGPDVVHRSGAQLPLRIGRLRSAEAEITEALNVVDFLLRSPQSLAWFLEAANYEVVKLAGKIVATRRSTLEPSRDRK